MAAAHDIQLQYKHIPGVLNKEADVLSRAFDPSCDLAKLLEFEKYNWWPVQGLWCYPNALL